MNRATPITPRRSSRQHDDISYNENQMRDRAFQAARNGTPHPAGTAHGTPATSRHQQPALAPSSPTPTRPRTASGGVKPSSRGAGGTTKPRPPASPAPNRQSTRSPSVAAAPTAPPPPPARAYRYFALRSPSPPNDEARRLWNQRRFDEEMEAAEARAAAATDGQAFMHDDQRAYRYGSPAPYGY